LQQSFLVGTCDGQRKLKTEVDLHFQSKMVSDWHFSSSYAQDCIIFR
jgi:hypothetical protein